ncbi:MFS transporter [candidate division WOR-3 bacterium]|uniref:MFS transporter n=1 Tax=candidate division WOR-3 bacterium TaxID=2052148 RepID=A0A937XHW6_UNCW3|nr:MFS transporter [candidate division WOR-3 bacterium]
MGSAVNVALPRIGEEFGMNAITLGWVATSYILAAAIGLVPLGRLADMRGRKRVFVWGVVVFTMGSIASALSVSTGSMIAARIAQGLGGAMVFGTGTAILTSVYPPQLRGHALGINVATVYVGLTLGPTLGGVMTQALGWRSVFWAGVPLGVAVVALVLWKLEGEWFEARGERFDVAGMVIYSLALFSLMYGFALLPALFGAGLVGVGLVGLVGFVLLERRIKNPVLDISLFSGNRVFALSNISALVNYSATAAVSFLLSLYLQYARGLDARGAGLLLVAGPVVQAAISPLAGRLSDRVEPRIVASVGMGLTVVGLVFFVFLGSRTPLGLVVAGLVLLGAGFGLFSSPNMNAIMGCVEWRYYGTASGMVATMRMVGQMFSMGIAMLLLALFVGRVQITPNQHAGLLPAMRIAFGVFAALCLGGVFASLARGKLHRE